MIHKIQQQRFQLTAHNKDAVLAWQEQVRDSYWQKTVPALEQLFNQFSTEDTLSYIDLLEVDLGRISAEDLEPARFTTLLLQKLTVVLQEWRQEQPAIADKTLPQHAFEQWLYYMEKGTLPWDIQATEAAWLEKIQQTLALDFAAVERLRALLLKDADSTRRVVYQHTPSFLQQLLVLISAQAQEDWETLLRQLYEVYARLTSQTTAVTLQDERYFSLQGWQCLLLQVARHPKGDNRAAIIGLLEQWPVFGVYASLLVFWCKERGWPALTAVATEWMEKKTDMENNTADHSASESVVNAAIVPMRRDSTAIQEPDKESWYTGNAGIVLLHNWLLPLFLQLEWVEGRQFRDIVTQQQAILLLHYMCTGSQEAAEYEVLLPKVLCGWPLHKPVDTRISLPAAALEEAAGLMENAIAHWQVLKSTSVKGLQEAFLQRPGKLSSGEDHWRLQMEKHTIDILLDHLPWSISVIKLPWMKKPLHVEWR